MASAPLPAATVSLLACEIDGERLVELTAVVPPLVLAGIGRLEDLSAQDATLSTVFVHESLRRRGIGRQLVRAATAWAAGRGLHLYLHVHPANPARHLYLAEGFEDCGGPPTAEGHQWLVKWAPEGRVGEEEAGG
jgi:GNAT superfamily N-acetyltransferase